jgi:hypothetical protein
MVDKWTRGIADCRLKIDDWENQNGDPEQPSTLNLQSSIPNHQSSIVNPWPRPGLTRSKGEMPGIKHQQNQEHSQSISRQGGHQSKEDASMNFERALEEFMGRREVLTELLEAFQKNTRAQIGTIRQAISDGDAEVVMREAHSIKGGAANLSPGILLRLPLNWKILENPEF